MYYESEAEKGRFTGSIIRAMAEAMHLSESTVYKLKRIVETYSESEIEKITNINIAYRQTYHLNDTHSECEAEVETTTSPETANNDESDNKTLEMQPDTMESLSTGELDEMVADEVVEGVVVPRCRLEGLIDPSANNDQVIDAICDALRLADHINKIQSILATAHASQIDEG